MRIEFLQSIDFNQMLVYSTFVHLLCLTVVMFLPSPRIQEQIIVPTFRLDLVELPSVVKSTPTPEKKKKVVAQPVKKSVASKPKLIAQKQGRKKKKTLKPKPKPESKFKAKPEPKLKAKPELNGLVVEYY